MDGADTQRERTIGSCVVLIGASGAGKTTTGWLLARLLGYGFADLDQLIEKTAGRSVQQIFAEDGEDHFRSLEAAALRGLLGLKTHVISTGGGAVLEDSNWEMFSNLGAVVWINTPAEEIARRLSADPAELEKRPLLADALTEKNPEARQKLLTARIKALIGNRQERYKRAEVVVQDAFSTPESTAHLIRETLAKNGVVRQTLGASPLTRWQPG